MLNKVLTSIAIVALFVSVAFEVNFINYSTPVEHKDVSVIKLKDFKGFKRLNQTLYGNSEFAFIETEIKIIGSKYPYVKSYFHPARSYTYKANIVGDVNLLTHELYHFHITEYIARQMRQEISQRGYSHVDLREMLKRYKAEEDKIQQRYDTETYHSYFSGSQIAWQKKIDSLLLTLNKYK